LHIKYLLENGFEAILWSIKRSGSAKK
jgi:hypothetical protein